MKPRPFRLSVAALLAVSGSFAAAEGLKHPFCATYPGSDLVPMVRSLEARARRGMRAAGSNTKAAEVTRNGNVAMLLDKGDLVYKANSMDLQGKGLEFRPGYTVSRVDRPLGPDGTAITLGDDDSREVPLPFAFPFFGKTYDKAFVNSDGNLTFEAADNASTSRTLSRLVAGPPRVAPLLADLDPGKGGRITTTARADGFSVKWTEVPQFEVADKNTFELTLFPDGRISFSYDATNLSPVVQEGASGISAGGSIEGLQTADLSEVAGLSFSRSIGESFHSEVGIDLEAVARAFYSKFGDDYQQLLVYTNRSYIPRSQSAFAYETTVKNQISGIGTGVGDDSASFGSRGTLESMVLMDTFGKYSANPADRVLREETTLSVLAHEVGHRWLATARFSDGGVSSTELLGRQQAHWSFYMHSSGSHDEGNDIEIGRRSVQDRWNFKALRTARSVPDGHKAERRGSAVLLHPQPDRRWRAIGRAGARVQRGHQGDPQGCHGGRRHRSHGAAFARSGSEPPAWRVAFLYVTDGDSSDGTAVALVESIRSQFEAYFSLSTEGRLSIETRLK